MTDHSPGDMGETGIFVLNISCSKNWQLLFTYTFKTDVLYFIRKQFSVHELCQPLE